MLYRKSFVSNSIESSVQPQLFSKTLEYSKTASVPVFWQRRDLEKRAKNRSFGLTFLKILKKILKIDKFVLIPKN
jgi:hypothetical protein